MDLDIHVYHHFDQPQADEKLDQILRMLHESAAREKASANREKALMADTTALHAIVTRIEDQSQDTASALRDLAALVQNATGQDEIDAVVAQLTATADELEGVTNETDPTPDPAPDPEPSPEEPPAEG